MAGLICDRLISDLIQLAGRPSLKLSVKDCPESILEGLIMRTACLILSLIAIGLSWPITGLGLDSSSGDDYSQGAVWFSSYAPDDDDQLTVGSPSFGRSDRNSLWVEDSNGREKERSLKAPQGVWVSLAIVPKSGGELKLYCRYPTGTVDLLFAEDVRKGYSYRAWYHTELEGDYEIWYTLDGSKSNSIELQVKGEIYDYLPVPTIAEGATAVPTGAAPATSAVSATSAAPVMYEAMPAPSPSLSRSSSIGFSTGGAKDINNFRENIEAGYLPLPTDITYEGLFYDYFFETGQTEKCDKLFCPSYSYALSRDPFSNQTDYYLSVGMNSGIQDFQRKKLNLMVVLDFSGSMGSPFDQYYYDQFGNEVAVEGYDREDSEKTKMEIADQSVVALMSHLKEGDRFGMVVFSDEAFIVEPLTDVGDKDLSRVKDRILDIRETGGTNMEEGMKRGSRFFQRYLNADPSEYENRIIFLTDAMPNMGETGDWELSTYLAGNAANRIYTTFIGVGLDFNTELTEAITKVKGANYYSVHSAREFEKRMDEEFDYMVTPLVFDLRLNLNATGYEIEKVYGSPEADQATGDLMKVNTLFPSKAEEGQVKGGVILVKLKKLSDDGRLNLKVSYEDRNGVPDSDEADVAFGEEKPDFYQNSGIRKAVLLSRYADLLKDWTLDERRAASEGQVVVPSVTLEHGIVIPIELGEWERQSMELRVAEPYRKLFGIFGTYFDEESKAIGDDTLEQEEAVLEKLSSTGSSDSDK